MITPERRAQLREEMLASLAVAAAEAGGVERIERAPIAVKLQAAGLARSTAFAWIAQAIDAGEVEAELVNRARGAGGAAVPPQPRPHPVATAMPDVGSTATPPALRLLEGIVRDLLAVRQIAFHPDGRVRNARLLVTASENLRRAAESALKIQQAMSDLASLERFHAEIIAVIQQESPDLARRVLRRMDELAIRWGG